MNRDETIELTKVMQAFADGRAVQSMPSGIWIDVANPSWDPRCKWRIKPPPRSWWELRTKDGLAWGFYNSKQEAETAKKNLQFSDPFTIHEYREVMP